MRYELTAEASRLYFSARSSLHPIDVEVPVLRGQVEAEGDGQTMDLVPGGWLEVELSAIRSGNPLIDRETHRRLDLRAYPRLTAELTGARPIAPGRAACRGQVTFQGSTQPLSGELQITTDGDGTLHLTGRQEVDVRRWGLKPPRLLVLKVDPEVVVELDVWARPVEAGSGGAAS